ncbi:2,3-diaminopropionate biosynthesis protein SbnB [Micromonospora sp. WMMD987]|uniref:2,3-diaminopropionate biosynthesis protein SbnB n=1 Tax=Micromonospora sp. WMMD987 TaxID=3016089 RepID=UPI00249A829D|nr:2,3-diaminopropionate biosynthesis protein SbnB [Micromonospora sp. WMMD987]WFE96104.1 2,3-diaminopropionate biosynthesis protein SbnB [Micromonospora sp. WMMD987]
MSTMFQVPPFAIISGRQVHDVLHGREREVTELVESAYRLHGEGETTNPDSYFLRFPDRPRDRIIALPASVRGKVGVHGLKWISSFPENVAAGIPRASAVLVLNDFETGYPIACLEASIISAARTAASAASAAVRLSAARGVTPRRLGVVGAGVIARYTHRYLHANGLRFESVGVHDLSAEHAAGFGDHLRRCGEQVVTHDRLDGLLADSDLVLFTTVAGEPHVSDPALFGHAPLVLHLSLRDLDPDVILDAWNVVDDVEHVMKAGTSVHLTEQRVGHRDFVAGTLCDVLTGGITPPADRPVVFSPFGLGVLDLVLAKHVYDQVSADDALVCVPDFFHDVQRYG